MIEDSRKTRIESLAAQVGSEIVGEFLTRMDDEYFSRFSPEEILTHMKMSQTLGPDQPVQVVIRPGDQGGFDIIVVAFDYFSEFSIICGLLSAFGLDIAAGDVYTFSPQPAGHLPSGDGVEARPGQAKIVDVFSVRPQAKTAFENTDQVRFETELKALVGLLKSRMIREARERLNRKLVERIEQSRSSFVGLESAVEIAFDNSASEKWTVLDVRAKNTPAFLYAFSTGLAMREVYIHKVRIESSGEEARDRFFISDRRRRKIESEAEQKTLRMTVALIKRFTFFLPHAPDPAKALEHFDQLLDKVLERGEAESILSAFVDDEGLDLLALILGTSDFLWEDFLKAHVEWLLPALNDLKAGSHANRESLGRRLAAIVSNPGSIEIKKAALNELKDRELFLIDLGHLLEPQVDFTEFSARLTALAEGVIDAALQIARNGLVDRFGSPLLRDGGSCPFSIFGLGKLGGRELGYASDLELLCLYRGAGRTDGARPIDNGEFFHRLVQDLMNLIEAKREGIFNIDLRLRPYGKAGGLATPFEQAVSYYSPAGSAHPFERQALIRLRRVAGDNELGAQMEAHRDRYVYGGEPFDLDAALHLRRRQVRELVKPGEVNVKYSPGGIIDIEYSVQYLQLMHGAKHTEVRTPSTAAALEALCALGIISRDNGNALRRAYTFLRALIDGLRVVRGESRDLLVPAADSLEMKFLSRRLGYRESNWDEAARRLSDDIRENRLIVNRFFLEHFASSSDDARVFSV